MKKDQETLREIWLKGLYTYMDLMHMAVFLGGLTLITLIVGLLIFTNY